MQETAQQPILIKRKTSVSKKPFNGYQIAASLSPTEGYFRNQSNENK
jgi:hypothetical protein